MKRLFVILICLLSAGVFSPIETVAAGSAVAYAAKDNTNSKEAKELFDKVYNLVFGKEGSSLSYAVNIIGIYKTAGDIVYKGNKVHYAESRYMAWEDGVTAYMVDKKKKVVNVYKHDDDAKDEYLAKFKYDVNNFDISYTTDATYYNIKAKVRNAKLLGIREVVAKVNRKTLAPVALTIKLPIIQTTVKITNFKSGNISDSQFVFPRKQFQGYEFVDMRKEK